MKQRHFLTAAALGGASLSTLAQTASAGSSSPVLLTVTGAIGKVNRGPIDPALDQMVAKQKISFERARGFDFGELAALQQ